MSTVERTSYADRVRAGVALLDEKKPGWHKVIDLKWLNLSECKDCILGQSYGHFSTGLFKLFGVTALTFDDWWQLDQAIAHGFDAPNDDADRGYPTLERLWAYVIRQRQAVAS